MGARQLFIYVIFSYFDREKKLYTTFHRYLFLRAARAKLVRAYEVLVSFRF